MKYRAEVNVMPLKELLDPQGKAVASSMKNLNLDSISAVRIGKHISLILEADTQEKASKKVDDACNKLLANPVIEYYEFEVFQEDN